jgi:hypothetical protein
MKYNEWSVMAADDDVLLCGSCKLCIQGGEKTIKCDSDCLLVFHLRCTDIKEPAYKVIREHPSIFWSCEQCSHEKRALSISSKQALERISELVTKMDQLQRTVQEHDKIIKENKPKVTYASSIPSANKPKNDKSQIANETHDKDGKSKENNIGSKKTKWVGKKSNKSQNNVIENNEKEMQQNDSDAEFTPVVHNKSRKVKVFGTGGSGSSCTLSAITRKAHLHVWRLSKDTSDVALREYLENALDSKNVIVESLTTKRDYASFKVSVDFDLMDKVYKPDLWPKNTAVSRFKFLNKPEKKD